MKDIALVNKHIELGAKLIPFAGFNMPVQYEGVNIEHETVRNGVGVFDVSHKMHPKSHFVTCNFLMCLLHVWLVR